MKICQLNLLNTSMILQGIYYIFQICFGINFYGFEFQVGGNGCKIIIYDVSCYLFLAHYFIFYYKHYIVHVYIFIGKKWFYGYREFLVVRNTFDINNTKMFSLVWRSNLTQKSLCFLHLSQFSSDLFLLKLFLSLELSVIVFLRDLVVKALLLKRRTFTLTSAIFFKSSRKTYWRVD